MTGTTEILFFSSWKSTNVFTATTYVTVCCKGVLINNKKKTTYGVLMTEPKGALDWIVEHLL